MRRKTSVVQEKNKIVQLTVNVTDHNDSAGVVRVDSETVRLLVEDLGGGENQRVEDMNWKNRREFRGRNILGRPVKGRYQILDPT